MFWILLIFKYKETDFPTVGVFFNMFLLIFTQGIFLESGMERVEGGGHQFEIDGYLLHAPWIKPAIQVNALDQESNPKPFQPPSQTNWDGTSFEGRSFGRHWGQTL